MNRNWDSHIHLFPEEMQKSPAIWADSSNEPIWKACVAPSDRPSIQGWATEEQLLNSMDMAEIETVVLLGWYWENHQTCQMHNRFYAKLIKKYPNRLKAFVTVQPQNSDAAIEEISWAIDTGFLGLGEIHPQAQGFSLRDDCWQKILNFIKDKSFPINLHVTEPDSKPHPGKIDTPLEDYVQMATSWPDQVVILAHLGGRIPLKQKEIGSVSSLKNIYYDTAATPLLYKPELLKEIAEEVGIAQILFGSDYPLRVFPREQKIPEFSKSVQFIRDSGLTEKDLERVLSSNAKRLFSVRK
ncbi:MAG: amidohydrolase family protein [Verrucomicrobia bacterium]|nr:amidohydrolase family protein [Verrucomicrobiota bacterium]MDA1065654.1 amidohydrolase family protein [Verrucomicrobiota bacterium]